ncbi:MAG: hypothetical protein K9I69_00630 [Ignavibacteriales bacterium]|nr:hypothetical protein [Ignavibacteriales bacterium]MCF8306531.1 hypothetical protein [Ignavibacteriales bacterium]MCF8316330.1 hypothetical protein [Ignavibacteriales bacterium]MCF8437712.1 hypothetical protein [Ignavibacteriales bacterium]
MRETITLPDNITAIIFCGLFLYFPLSAQPLTYSVQHITVNDGLSQNMIYDIDQDNAGFIWIATEVALDRHDGKKIRSYSMNRVAEQLSTNDFFIVSFPDQFNNIMVAGNPWGLFTYDYNKEEFSKIDLVSLGLSFKLNTLQYLNLLDNGNIWFGDYSRIIFCNPLRKITDQYLVYKGDEALSDLKTTSVIETQDAEMRVWSSTREGLFVKKAKDKVFQYVHLMFGEKKSFQINDLYSLSDSNLLLAERDGLFIYDINSGNLQKIFFNEFNNEDSNVFSIIKSRFSNQLVIGTSRGIYFFDPKSKQIVKVKISNDISDKTNFEDGKRLFEDRSGILWIGTSRNGLIKLTPNSKIFDNNIINSELKSRLSELSIWCYSESQDDKILIGTLNNIIEFSPYSESFREFKIPGSSLKNPSQIRAIRRLPGSENDYLVGTLANGLMIFNVEKGEFSYPFEFSGYEIYAKGHAYMFHETPERNFLIGFNGEGLIHLDLRSNQLTKIHLVDSKLMQFYFVLAIAQAGTKSYWVALLNHGLFHVNLSTEQNKRVELTDHRGRDYSRSRILSLFQEDTNTLWIGTWGDGLLSWEIPTGKLKVFDQKQGLPDNTIYAILQDRNNILWLSSNKGLIRFNPRDNSMVNYTYQDGLPDNEFNLGASYQDKNGLLYFGTNKGMVCFHPDSIRSPFIYEPVISNFKVAGELRYNEISLAGITKVELSSSETSFSFDLNIPVFLNKDRGSLQWILEGHDDDWRIIKEDGTINYSKISPGNYTLKVRTSDQHDSTSKRTKILHLSIAKPFWQSWGFFILIIFLFGAAIYFIIRWKTEKALAEIKIRNAERERIILKISEDFHDDLSALITGIKGKANRLIKRSDEQSTTSDLKRIISFSDKLNTEIRQILWEINPKNETLYDIVLNLYQFYETLFDDEIIDFQIVGLEPEISKLFLPINWRQHLPRIFKEGFHNIKKHVPDCTLIRLSIQFSQQELLIDLRNDGKPFENKNANGSGLKNMFNRAKRLNGKLEIISSKNRETILRFSGKLPIWVVFFNCQICYVSVNLF